MTPALKAMVDENGDTMLLLHCHWWFGPGRAFMNRSPDAPGRPEVHQRHEGLVTRLSLGAALEALRDYEDAHARRFNGLSAVEYSLLGVSTIPALTDEQMTAGKVHLIEEMLAASLAAEVDETAQ